VGIKGNMDFVVSSYALCTIFKKELRKVVETGILKIVVIMADMQFRTCSEILCTILKKEVRRVVETGI
jgi:hypothetical protein